MNDLTTINNNQLTIDTREVAQMMGVRHGDVLRKLEGSNDGKRVGIIPVLTQHQMSLSKYFIESSYIDESGKENKCYLCTKLGCDFLANKFTGEKGILFTAKYVERFDQMEKQIQNTVLSFQIEDPVERAKAWIVEYEKSKALLKEKQDIIEELSPFAKLARERMDKTGTVSLTDVTKSFELKKGQISCWAKIKGYLSKAHTEVNNLGDKFFKVVSDVEGHKGIAIREEGIKLIDENIKEIKESPCRFSMKLIEEV